MRIAVVCHSGSAALGGAERCTLEALDGLRKNGADCVAFVPGRGALFHELLRLGFETEVVGYTWWMSDDTSLLGRLKRLARNLWAATALADLFRRLRCDVVYTSTATVVSGALGARLAGLPHVWHLYEFGVEDHGLHFDLGREFSCRLMGRLSVVCVAVSRAIERHYAPFIPADKLKLVYFAVDPAVDGDAGGVGFRPGSALKCLLAGRLQENKGQQDALRAVAELARDGVEASLLIVGRGDAEDQKRLEDLCRELDLGARAVFGGPVKAVLPLIKAADVVLMCSRQEALGRITVEAMYAGRPVVGARSGGTPELIEEKLNGLLYEPGDAKDLARCLRYLAEHPDERRAMGENARRWVGDRFSRERLGRELWAVIRPLAPAARA